MEVIHYDPTLAEEATACYNRMVAGVPHCYPVSVEDFAATANVTVGEGSGPERLHDEAAWVVRDGSAVCGYAHAALERPEEGPPEPNPVQPLNPRTPGSPGEKPPDQGIIRFLAYEPGHRAAGQALLKAVEEYLRSYGVKRVEAFLQPYRYPFYYFGYAYLSDQLGHVQALFGLNGYGRVRGEVCLDWPDYAPPAITPAEVSADFSLDWQAGRGERPNLVLHARQGERPIGICHNVSMGEYARAAAAQDWFLTKWLGVEEDFQGRGLGRELLQRALHALREAGYRHALISTNWQNFRALLFYTNFGYTVRDWTYGYAREWTEKSQ